MILSTLLTFSDKLTSDHKRSALEINAIPCETEYFPFPHSGKKGNFIQILMSVSLDCLKKLRDLLILQRDDFLAYRAR